METMKVVMSDLLAEFFNDVESYLAEISTIIDSACTSIVRATVDAGTIFPHAKFCG